MKAAEKRVIKEAQMFVFQHQRNCPRPNINDCGLFIKLKEAVAALSRSAKRRGK